MHQCPICFGHTACFQYLPCLQEIDLQYFCFSLVRWQRCQLISWEFSIFEGKTVKVFVRRNPRNGGKYNLEPVQVNDLISYSEKVSKQVKFPHPMGLGTTHHCQIFARLQFQSSIHLPVSPTYLPSFSHFKQSHKQWILPEVFPSN